MTEKWGDQMTLFTQDGWSGKTSLEPTQVTMEKTSKQSSRKSSALQNQTLPMCLCLKKNKWTKSGCIYDEMGRWSVAWRLHDAQFWGVPQRRKRIALVADFGGLSAPEVLFERKGLSGDSEQSKKEGQETARAVGKGTNSPSAFGIDKAITTGGNCTAGGDCVHKEYVPALTTDRPHSVFSFQERCGKPGGGKGILIQDEHCGALSTLNNQSVCYSTQASGDRKEPSQSFMEEKAYTIPSNSMSDRGQAVVYMELNSTNYHAVAVENHGKNKTFSFDPAFSSHFAGTVFEDVAKTLTPGTSPGFHDGVCCISQNEDIAGTLDANYYKGCGERQGVERTVVCSPVVRRLTPLECERLQGFPDWWTNIGEWTDSNGKKHKDADSPRYKALGNSIALPFWFWLLRRISAMYERPATLGSLFDGIGGFPLCWERCNGMGTAIWASEIEEFPIAVTKKRFNRE